MRSIFLTERNKNIPSMVISKTSQIDVTTIFVHPNYNRISHINPWSGEKFSNYKVYIFMDCLKISSKGLITEVIPYSLSSEEFFQNSLLNNYFSVQYEWLQEAKEYFDFITNRVLVIKR